MTRILVELFKHNRWANLRLLDACAALPDEQLDAGAPGTYGRARDTLLHLCAAEGRYVATLTGETPEHPLRESEGFPGLDVLRVHIQRSGERLIEIAGRIRPTRVLRGTWRGQPYALPAAVPLIQAINHATEHRAHVVTSLSQLGVALPALDGWHYGDEAIRPS